MNREFLHPRHWHTQIGLGLLYLISRFPLSSQYSIGKYLGRMLFPLLKSRRHTTLTNIKLCFPELSAEEHEKLAKEVFEEVAIGLLEAAYIWWNNPKVAIANSDFYGLELIDEALKENRGLLLIGAHFTSLEIAGTIMGNRLDLDVTYRQQSNALMDDIIFRKRQRHFKYVIDRLDIRRFFKSLKQNRIVWYAPDQDYGAKHSVFANFFGVNAASIVATSKILNFNNSPALFVSHHRDQNNRYQFTVSKFNQHLPSESPSLDAQIINDKIEEEIRKYPAQYMWTHRRFKSQPEGAKSVY